MKNSIYLLAATMFVGGAIVTGCKPSAEKVEKAEEKVVDAKQDLKQAEADYAMAVQEFRNETEQRITENERMIAEFNAKTTKAKKEIKADYKEVIGELEVKNQNLKKRMDEYQDKGKDNWESFKTEFNHDMDELGQALKDLTVDNKK